METSTTFFTSLAQKVGLEILVETGAPVVWLESGNESRPALIAGSVWLTSEVKDGLVPHLAKREASGLWCAEPSEALVAACRQHGLGLAALPPWLAPDRVLKEARQRLADVQAPAALALVGMLEVLMRSAERERELLATLARWLHCPLALLAPWGQLVAWAGEIPREQPTQPGWGPGYLALRAGQGLLVAYGPPAALEPGRALLELAARLLGIKALEDRAQRAEEEGLKGALLDDLLVGEADPSRARAFGFEGNASFVLALVEAAPILGRHRLAEMRRRESLSALRGAASAYLERLGVPYLLSERGGRAVLLWGSHSVEAEVEALLRAVDEPVRLGYSARHDALKRVPQAYREAVIALKTARLGAWASFAKLDPVAWVLLQQGPEDLRALVERFLPLPPLFMRTLEVYLESSGGAKAAAQTLHLHPNTLRYRLQRIEEALGLSLKSPEALAQIHLALRAKGLLEEENR